MSLEIIAQRLAKKGRGPDTLLVHMAPSEVAGLQSLAQAGGGSLTVNPDTGLPEAGFLSDLLPSIIGFGVSALSGGTLSPLMIGAGVGGLTALTSGGDLGKGVMAGLGAYGGAGLGAGLMGLGTGAMQQQAGAAASQGLEGLAADQAAERAITARMAQATPMQTMTAGAQYAMNNPKDAIAGMGGWSGFGKNALMAAAPVIASETATPMPGSQSSPALFRKMRMNPDGSFTEIGSTPMKEYGSTPFERYAAGGAVNTITKMPDGSAGQTPSERAMDFLMGRTNTLKPSWETKKPAVKEKEKLPVVEVVKPPVLDIPQAGAAGESKTASNPSGYDWISSVNPFTGGPQALMNGPLGYAVGKVSNAFATPKTEAEILSTPVVDMTPTPTQTSIDYGKSSWGKTGDEAQDIGTTQLGSGITGADKGGGIASLVNSSYDDSGSVEHSPLGGTSAYSDRTSPVVGGPINLGLPVGTALAPAYTTPTQVVDPAQAREAAALAQAQAENAAQAQREAANMASRAQAEREAAAQAARAIDTAGSTASDGGYGGFGGNTGGDGAMGFGGQYAQGGLASLAPGYAAGGYSLGGYSDGGRLLRGPGDGVSDHIPATIGRGKQPARLADGEFVLPARIVSELGNGSTEAGARALYAMMDRIQNNRRKTVGKGKVAVNSKSTRLLPA